MTSFLPVIVSKNNKQTEKNMSFIALAVYHKFIEAKIQINPNKKKPHQNDWLMLFYID